MGGCESIVIITKRKAKPYAGTEPTSELGKRGKCY